MASQAVSETFRASLSGLLIETFEQVDGYYLDEGTSLFETLETVTSDEASRPVSATCASIAGQVEHTRIYIWLLTELLRGKQAEISDWQTTWAVTTVSDGEWEALKDRLRGAYGELRQALETPATWERDDAIADSMAVVVHTAYHLGEIRQALCTVK
jgi:hypothetical protein